jgi:hypothetical protein
MSTLYREPIRNTCPKIDRVILQINGAIGIIDNKEDSYLPEERLTDIRYQLDDMEELREENHILRSWGNDLVSHAEQLDSEIEYKDQKIYELVDEIESLRT